MKILMLLLSLSFVASSGFAQTVSGPTSQAIPTPARDLELVMKDLGALFKILKTQINDATLNPSSIAASQAMAPLLVEATAIVPESVTALPLEKQHLQILLYQKLLLQVSVANIDLETALTNGDQAAALSAFTQIGSLISNGHSIFRP